MPNWTFPAGSIKPLVVFHGTDASILTTPGVTLITGLTPTPGFTGVTVVSGFKANLALCRANTDFGQGFYVTTSLHQARQWANARFVRTAGAGGNALVVAFALDRDWLASLESVAFARPIQDFWDLVTDCRHGFRPHQRLPPHNPPFDIVYGPVTIWPSKLVIQDCDQVSFHTTRAVRNLADPWIADRGTPTFP